MGVSPILWWITIFVTIGLLVIDVVVVARRPHEPTMKECARALAGYVGLAVLFGAWVLLHSGGQFATEFFAGWLTEYSLSVDNLFIFIIIMARFGVPKQLQQSALLIGIVLALVMRGIFIAVGASAIAHVSWIFYVFGAFLLWTAFTLVRNGLARREGESSDSESPERESNRFVAWLRGRVPATEQWHGSRLVTRGVGGHRASGWVVTPMLLVIVTLGTTDFMFALDSIPAIYGLTKEPYLVLTANIFALMGLRQLYFLLGGVLERLIFLSYGLSFLLAFIGVKLVLHALHENELPFVNAGHGVHSIPDIPIWLSLVVIVATLVTTAVASVVVSARRERVESTRSA